MMSERDDIIEALVDVVWQYAIRVGPEKQYLHHCCLSAMEDAFDTLVSIGRMKKVDEEHEWYEMIWEGSPNA